MSLIPQSCVSCVPSGPSEILTPPQAVRVVQGKSAFLDCDVDTDPRLRDYQVVWKKANRKLEETSVDDK